jgi:hypothetical protein
MPGYGSVSFDPGVIAAASDAASSALALAGQTSDAASAAYYKAAAASSRIASRSAAWEATGMVPRAIKTVIDDYTILNADGDIVCQKSTQLNLTLPSGVAGDLRNIKNVGTGPVVITGPGSVTIDGETSQVLYQGESAQLECCATNTWVIV